MSSPDWRFRDEDRKKIGPQLAAFLQQLDPDIPQAALIAFLALGDTYLRTMIQETLKGIAPTEQQRLRSTILSEADHLATALQGLLDSQTPFPPATIAALIYLLNVEISKLEQNPWENPWLLKALKDIPLGEQS